MVSDRGNTSFYGLNVNTITLITKDPVGNRTSASNATGSISHNANNELLSYGEIEFLYDANGNMIQKKLGTVAVNYIYNADNRLIRVEDELTGTVIAEYYYDPFGRRLWKNVGGTRTYFFYSDEGLVAEYDSSGVEIRSYGYQPNSTWTTDPLFLKQNGRYYFYQNDHLGTPQKLVAQNGAVVWSATYSAFGKASVDIETVTNNLRFPGQYFDAETGWHYNWFRYYASKTGRYTQADPIGFLGRDVNFYGYAYNAPCTTGDPTGLQPVPQIPLDPLINPPGTVPEIPITQPPWEPLPLPKLPKGNPTWLPRIPGGPLVGGLIGGIIGVLVNPTWAEAPDIDVPPVIDPRPDPDDDDGCCTDDAGRQCEECGGIIYFVIPPGVDRAMFFGHAFLKLPEWVGYGWTIRDFSGSLLRQVLKGEAVPGELSIDTELIDHQGKIPLKVYKACPESVAAVNKAISENLSGDYHLYNELGKNCYGWAAMILELANFTPPIASNRSFSDFKGQGGLDGLADFLRGLAYNN